MYTQDSAAWRMLVSKFLVIIHCETTLICDLLWTPSLKQFLVVCKEIKQHLSFPLDQKGHTTFMCGLISFDLGSDYLHKFPLHSLCKGEALDLFSVE
jgi:hypothetical protein